MKYKLLKHVGLGALAFGFTLGTLNYSKDQPQELLYRNLDGLEPTNDDIIVRHDSSVEARLRSADGSYHKSETLRKNELASHLKDFKEEKGEIRSDFNELEDQIRDSQ